MQQSNINEYIKTICEQIRWKKAHGPISEEIESHIIDQKNAFIKSGLDDRAATEKAIKEMGDPVVIGTEFDRSYRPKIERSIVVLTCVLVLTGLLVRYFVIYNAPIPFEFSVINDFFSIIIGFVCMFMGYFIDFTVIGKHPKKIFFVLTALLVLLNVNNNQVNISSKFLLVPTVFSFILLLFPTAFAGIIYTMRQKSYLGIIQTGLIFSISAVVCLNTRNTSAIVTYGISCLVLLTMAILNGCFNVKKSSALLLVYGASTLIFVILISIAIVRRPTIITDIEAVFNPTLDPRGSGWITIAVRNVLSGAKFIGQGDLGEYTTIPLPSIHSDFLLTYLIHKLGWISFIVIMTIIITFIVRLYILCKKQKSVLAKLVSTSILITFTMQVVVYVFYNLGFQLLSPLTLPFISYGGTSTIINMFLIGILLSVFNLGDLIRDNNTAFIKYNKLFEFAKGKIIINLNAR